MYKKILSTMFVLVLSASLLAGCGAQTGDNSTTGNSTTEGTASQTSATQEPLEIKIFAQDFPEPVGSYNNNLPVMNELQKRTNTKIIWDVYSPDTLKDIINTRLASGLNLGDIIDISLVTDISSIINNKLIIPLDDLINNNAPNYKKAIEQDYPSIGQYQRYSDGKIYWVTAISTMEAPAINTLIIRKDWLDALNLSMPTTTDEFYNVMKAFRDQDANKSGRKDEIFLSYGGNPVVAFGPSFELPLIQALAESSWMDGADGKIINAWADPKAKDLLAYLNKLAKEGIIEPTSLAPKLDAYYTSLGKNIVGADFWWPCQALMTGNQYTKSSNGSYTHVYPLAGPSGTKGAYKPVDLGAGKWAITKECKNPEAVMQFLDYLYSPEGAMLYRFGIEGVQYTIKEGGNKYDPNDEVENPEWTEKYKKDQQVQYTAGYNWVCLPRLYVMTSNYFFHADSQVGYFETINADVNELEKVEKDVQAIATPQFITAVPTNEENNELQAIGSEWSVYLNEQIGKVIFGQVGISDWDNIIAKANQLGMEKTQQIKQAERERFKKY